MGELRAFIDELRETYDVPYPLAHQPPFVSGRQLVREAQNAAHLGADFCLVAFASDQLILTPASDSFVQRVTWDGGVAAGWRPHDDPLSPVTMIPDVRFGRPAVVGVSTEIIWEHDQAGEGIAEIAEAFDLSTADVQWALSYENSVHAKPA
jgi:uncharacterized protein (DUF433 family)